MNALKIDVTAAGMLLFRAEYFVVWHLRPLSITYNLRMRHSTILAAMTVLLIPVWASIGLLRAQGLLASRSSTKPPVTGVIGNFKAEPAVVAGGALAEKVHPFRSKLRGGPAFIENRGQFDKNVRFQLASGGSTLWLTNSGITFDTLRSKVGAKTAKSEGLPLDPRSQPPHQASDFERLVVSENLVAANKSPALEAGNPQPGIYNYLIGDLNAGCPRSDADVDRTL